MDDNRLVTMSEMRAIDRYNSFLNSSLRSDATYYVLAILAGALAGYFHLGLLDPSLSVLLVTGATMFLSYRRPARVWHWAILMGLSLPASTLFALLTRAKPNRGMIAGSFAGLAFSIVAAVGGKFLRRVVEELFPARNSPTKPS